jgi:hypothetical protein
MRGTGARPPLGPGKCRTLELQVQACLDWSFILSMPCVNPVDQVLFAVLDPTHLSCGVVAYL